jgi:hypothetical protein
VADLVHVAGGDGLADGLDGLAVAAVVQGRLQGPGRDVQLEVERPRLAGEELRGPGFEGGVGQGAGTRPAIPAVPAVRIRLGEVPDEEQAAGAEARPQEREGGAAIEGGELHGAASKKAASICRPVGVP